jgi:hypothetical protein
MRPWREADHPSHLVPKLRMSVAYLHSTIRVCRENCIFTLPSIPTVCEGCCVIKFKGLPFCTVLLRRHVAHTDVPTIHSKSLQFTLSHAMNSTPSMRMLLRSNQPVQLRCPQLERGRSVLSGPAQQAVRCVDSIFNAVSSSSVNHRRASML